MAERLFMAAPWTGNARCLAVFFEENGPKNAGIFAPAPLIGRAPMRRSVIRSIRLSVATSAAAQIAAMKSADQIWIVCP